MKLENYNNLLELFFDRYQVENKNEIFLQSLKNQTLNFTWKQTYDAIQNFSFFLDQYISLNDRCLLISENRPEWLISDLAIMLSKGITVPAYTTYVERDYEFLIEDCKPSVVIVSDAIQLKKIKNLINKYSFIKKIISFDNIEDKNVTYIEEIFRRTCKKEKNLKEIEISRKDISCIIYTSGTQGNPKGVMLSHGGILNNCEGSSKLLREIITTKPKFLTWLPLSHSYEHTVQFVQIAVGARIFYAESIDKLVKNMNDCNPDIMTAVPRFYQNLYQKITSTVKKATGVKKFLINSTLQGYGLTETSPVVSCNPINDIRIDTVGPPLRETM